MRLAAALAFAFSLTLALPALAEQKAGAGGCANGVCALPAETASGADETFEQIEQQFKSDGKTAQAGRGMMNPAMMANCPCMKMMAMMMKMPGMQMNGMQMPGMQMDGMDHGQPKN